MDINTLEEKLGIAGLSDTEKLALVKGIESNVQASKAAVKAQEAGQYASLVVEAIKKIKIDLETRFNELNGIIDVKAKSLKDGKDGLQGPKGEKGDRGFDGANGKDGYNGKDGIDGVDGKDGVGVQDAYIDFDGSLVIVLTDGREINAGDVVPMDVAEKIKVIGNGGGTSQSVLDSLESLQTQIDAISGGSSGLTYKGTWNASTNTPTLASSTGTNGWYYVVSVAGSTNLNGVTDWQIGDWAIYNGSTWQKIDQTNTVTSVAGRTGAVTLTSTDVGLANVENKSSATIRGEITSSNVTTALGYTPYNSTNPSGYTSNTGTVTSVAALTLGTTGTDVSSTVANGTTTPVITLNVPTASATNRGALSSTDWSTFNGKQAALVSGTNIKTVNGTSLLGSGDVGVGVTSVTGTSPVASSGGTTPAISLASGYGDTQNPFASKTANYVLAAPNGSAGAPTFRAIVAADIPTLNQNTTGTASNVTGTVAVANGGTGATTAAGALSNLGAYAASNPSGYTSNTGTVTSVAMTTPTGLTVTGSPVTTSGTLALSMTTGYAIPTTSSQTNWDTAYTDRLKWDGGATGLTASTGRTSLGVTATGADTTYAYRSNNLSDLANATTARTNLGLGSAATLTAGSANGVATLDSGGKIPSSQLPAIAITDTFVVVSQAAMLALTAETGDVAVRSDLNKSFILTASPASTLANWQELLTPTDAVTSVAGRTGAVTLSTSDISGLGTIATQAANSVNITGGSITGITDLAVADGGTGASTASGARTNLGLVIGTDVLAPNGSAASLTSFPTFNQNTTGTAAGLSGTQTANYVYAAPNGSSGTASFRALVAADVPTLNQNTTGTASNVTGTVAVANGGTGATTASGARTNLGLVIGTDVLSPTGSAASLTSFPTLNQNTTGTASNVTGTVAVANGGTGSTTASGARTNLGLAIGTDVQAYDANTAKLNATQTFTSAQTFNSGNLKLAGSTSGTATLNAPAVASTNTYALPPDAATLGYRNVPAVGTKTGSYTLAVGDIGKYVQVGSGGSITIPNSTFAEGDAISIFNNTSAGVTITCSTTNAYIAGTDTNKSSVTLATRGVATVLFISSTLCVLAGNVS